MFILFGRIAGSFDGFNCIKNESEITLKTATLILNVIAALLLFMSVVYLLVAFAPVIPGALKVILSLSVIIYMIKQSVLLVEEVNEY